MTERPKLSKFFSHQAWERAMRDWAIERMSALEVALEDMIHLCEHGDPDNQERRVTAAKDVLRGRS